MANPDLAGPDPAVSAARRVVGLYGDPAVTWSIVLALTAAFPLERAAVALALDVLVAEYPHLGRRAELGSFANGGEGAVATAFADTPYGDQDPLLRAALSADGRTLVVAAHHGAADGLGLLGAAAALSGLDLASSARGIDPADEPGGFLLRVAGRLAEVALRPPARLAVRRRDGPDGDLLLSRTVSADRPGSAALVAGAVAAIRDWNHLHRAPTRGLVVAMGLSRRPGTPYPPPDRDTAYVRLAAATVVDTASAAALIAATAPEPAFPETDGGGIGPVLTRVLGSRLGATVLVSNLGVVADPRALAIRFWPVPTGPRGIAIGLASTGRSTTLTVRLRARWCSPSDAEDVADLVAARFAAAAGGPPAGSQ